jgi:lipoprotein-releasing system permease protein
VFTVQQDVDSKYILVPLEFVQELIQSEKKKYSSIEVICSAESKEENIRTELSNIFKNKVEIKNKFEQHTLLYQIMRTEKWAVFFILLFILIVASFNIVGSLTMLLVEKQKDLAVMKSMGAGTSLLKRIFITHGMQITLSGVIPGILLGLLICFLQQQFGFISLGESGSFIVDAYPVEIQWADVMLTSIAVLSIGFLASLYAVRGFSKMEVNGLSKWLKGE